jgi:DNA anti-recombination protein RmuC
VRSEVSDLRDEAGREVARLAARMDEVARAADTLQRRLQEGAEAQARTLRGTSEALVETLARLDHQLARMHDADAARLRAADDLVAALAGLRREAETARAAVSDEAAARLAELVDRTGAIAVRVAEPWERQLERLEALHDRVEGSVRRAGRRSTRDALRDWLRRS